MKYRLLSTWYRTLIVIILSTRIIVPNLFSLAIWLGWWMVLGSVWGEMWLTGLWYQIAMMTISQLTAAYVTFQISHWLYINFVAVPLARIYMALVKGGMEAGVHLSSLIGMEGK